MDVKIYTAVGCVTCREAKAFLAQHDVEFEECDISRNPEAMSELIRLGCRALPVIRIGERILQGFDHHQLSQALGFDADERRQSVQNHSGSSIPCRKARQGTTDTTS